MRTALMFFAAGEVLLLVVVVMVLHRVDKLTREIEQLKANGKVVPLRRRLP